MGRMKKTTIKNNLDKVFSAQVRKRGYCEWGIMDKCNLETLQCAHIYSRANLAVRWNLLNALCLCAGCHFYAHQHPLEFADFVKQHLGDYKYLQLKSDAGAIKKWTIADMQELLKTLKEIK